jgi:hypothetical protein
MPMKNYRISETGASITCLLCGRTSWNLNDVRDKYCGACHKFLEPETQEFFDHFERYGLPAMKESAMCIAIHGEKIDAKMCLEIGAAVLLDKPIIITVVRGAAISPALRRVASEIVEFDPSADGQKQIQSAIDRVLHRIK